MSDFKVSIDDRDGHNQIEDHIRLTLEGNNIDVMDWGDPATGRWEIILSHADAVKLRDALSDHLTETLPAYKLLAEDEEEDPVVKVYLTVEGEEDGCSLTFSRMAGHLIITLWSDLQQVSLGRLTSDPRNITYPSHPLGEGEFYAKTYRENKEWAHQLLKPDVGLFEDTGVRVRTGYNELEVWRLL